MYDVMGNHAWASRWQDWVVRPDPIFEVRTPIALAIRGIKWRFPHHENHSGPRLSVTATPIYLGGKGNRLDVCYRCFLLPWAEGRVVFADIL